MSVESLPIQTQDEKEFWCEEYECVKTCLDDAKVPTDDMYGNSYSLWGRVELYKKGSY